MHAPGNPIFPHFTLGGVQFSGWRVGREKTICHMNRDKCTLFCLARSGRVLYCTVTRNSEAHYLPTVLCRWVVAATFNAADLFVCVPNTECKGRTMTRQRIIIKCPREQLEAVRSFGGRKLNNWILQLPTTKHGHGCASLSVLLDPPTVIPRLHIPQLSNLIAGKTPTHPFD